ncbi:MAG: hypothetical protein IPI90_09540 [Saprospiraceae bacterium]|nr:hypothetical protein [Candidatus Vicinibacter affinis]
MKQLYCFFTLLLVLQSGFSQACLPDSTVKDSAVGVYLNQFHLQIQMEVLINRHA